MTQQQPLDRLFVPLRGDAFAWFESGEKQFELRRDRRQYSTRFVRTGRRVELRFGYSGRSLYGTIGKVFVGNDLQSLFTNVEFKKVVPPAISLDEAISIAEGFVGSEGPFILFEVEFCDPITQ